MKKYKTILTYYYFSEPSKKTTLLLLLSTIFSLAQTPIHKNLKHFDLHGPAQNVSVTYVIHHEKQDLAKDQNTFYVHKDSTFVEEYYFSKGGILSESKTHNLSGYEWTKYELSCNSPEVIVNKILIYTKKNSTDNYELSLTKTVEYLPNRKIKISTKSDSTSNIVMNTYDKKHNLTSEENLSNNKKITYSYDRYNNVLVTEGNGKIKSNLNITNLKNKLTKQVTYYDNYETQSTIIYNDKGLKQETISTLNDIHTFEYSYDQHDNWVSCKVFFNGHLVSEEFRNIVYENDSTKEFLAAEVFRSIQTNDFALFKKSYPSYEIVKQLTSFSESFYERKITEAFHKIQKELTDNKHKASDFKIHKINEPYKTYKLKGFNYNSFDVIIKNPQNEYLTLHFSDCIETADGFKLGEPISVEK